MYSVYIPKEVHGIGKAAIVEEDYMASAFAEHIGPASLFAFYCTVFVLHTHSTMITPVS